MTALEWLFWTVPAAVGLTYASAGSDLMALPRLYLQMRFPTTLGALVSCAPCSGFWWSLLVGAANYAGLCDTAPGRIVLTGLGVTGLLWILAAFSGGLAGIVKSLELVAQATAFRPRDNRAEPVEEAPRQEVDDGGR